MSIPKRRVVHILEQNIEVKFGQWILILIFVSKIGLSEILESGFLIVKFQQNGL